MGKKTFCYIGNWGKHEPSIGYTVCQYNTENGELRKIGVSFAGLSVGAHVIRPERKLLYCSKESIDLEGLRHGGGGEVISISIDPQTGEMTEKNSRPTLAALTSFVDVDPSGSYLAATNHGSRNYITKSGKDAFGAYHLEVLHDDATVVLYTLNADGSIGEICDIYYMEGCGPLPVQFAAHPHSVRFAPDGSFFLVCDKGGDQIVTFKIDRERNRMIPCMNEPFRAAPGSAPRYSVFHPNRPFVYTNNESSPIVYGFRYHSDGVLELICTVEAESDQELGGIINGQSDLRIGTDGRYLYSLMRGVNQIFVFEVNAETGMLHQIQTFQMQADKPRGCCLAPDGRFLLVAAIGSGEVLSYPVGPDGRLSAAVSSLEQPTPCAVVFYQP